MLTHARELGHFNSIGFCLAYSLFLDHLTRNPQAIRPRHPIWQCLQLADEHDFIMHNTFGLIFRVQAGTRRGRARSNGA
jgi:hypothetical protein